MATREGSRPEQVAGARSQPRVVWFDPARKWAAQPGFRSGTATRIGMDAEGLPALQPGAVRLSPNTVHALLGHGVAEALGGLEPEAAGLTAGREAWFRPARLPDLLALLYAADGRTYGARWQGVVFVVGRNSDGRTEHRIQIDNREYQRGLARLQHLAGTASRHGEGLRVVLGVDRWRPGPTTG